jgi:Icc-related predicted phosphoesterase
MKIVTLSDTHGHHRKVNVPDGDVLVFAGDFMTTGYQASQVIDFSNWLKELPHPRKVIIAGNHDRLVELDSTWTNELRRAGDYLQNSGVKINGVNFWGMPYTPAFCNWAFQSYEGDSEKFAAMIPEWTNVLVTHGPPYGILDKMKDTRWQDPLGDRALLARVKAVRPAFHVFGHIHEGYGAVYQDSTAFINTSICNEQYQPVNLCNVVEL